VQKWRWVPRGVTPFSTAHFVCRVNSIGVGGHAGSATRRVHPHGMQLPEWWRRSFVDVQ
jgi:hypothetical protein